jgi:hypothetical protein
MWETMNSMSLLHPVRDTGTRNQGQNHWPPDSVPLLGAPHLDFEMWETMNSMSPLHPVRDAGCPIHFRAFAEMGGKRCGHLALRAFLLLLQRKTTGSKWLFSQEKATLHDFKDSTLTGEML